MNAFTQGLDMELHGIGSEVKVQALCPGFTMTEFHDTLGVDRKNIPGLCGCSADDVVEASLRGLERGERNRDPRCAFTRSPRRSCGTVSHGLRRRIGKPGLWGKDKRV